MGNLHNKSIDTRNTKKSTSKRDTAGFSSQFSLTQLVGNLSVNSFGSANSNQSVFSASRPWSRVSRRRWNDSTLKNKFESSKTAWPVAHIESLFLPEFPISTNLTQQEFEIDEIIAKGAYGQVYKVNKVSEGKHYALKVLSKSQIIGESAVRQVKEEARIQEACGHHPFIAGAVTRWQTKKSLYIVSEYVAGGELLALIDKYGKLHEEVAKLLIAEIAIALDFLHNAGVIYRDLKAENVLLDCECHVRLIDFGLSKWVSLGARTSTLCGTLHYMAPEVLSGTPYGHAVDWWSLGVLACRLLTSQYPTPAVGSKSRDQATSGDLNFTASEQTVDNKDRREPPNLPPGTLPDAASELSKSARGTLMRLLERDPKVRLRSLRQLQQSAFYMGFDFDDVRRKKVSPRYVLEKYHSGKDIKLPSNKEFSTF